MIELLSAVVTATIVHFGLGLFGKRITIEDNYEEFWTIPEFMNRSDEK